MAGLEDRGLVADGFLLELDSGRDRMKHGRRDQELIREAMTGLSGPAANARAWDLALHFRTTVSTIYRISREARPARKLRSDKDIPRHGLPAEVLLRADGLIFNQRYTPERALEILEGNGLIEPGAAGAATLRRDLCRRSGFSGQDLALLHQGKERICRPYRLRHNSYAADYPNQVCSIDFTVAEQFYVDDQDELRYLSPLSHRRNSWNPRGRQLWIYQYTDCFSRCVFSRAYPGMDTTYILDFLFHCFAKKDELLGLDFPFYGCPEILQADGDSRLKSRLAERTIQLLGFTLRLIKCNPNANGMVERLHRTFHQVQNATRLRKFSLEDFNLLLLDEDLRYNWRKHSATGEKPFARFMTGTAGRTIRVLDDRALYDALLYDELYVFIHPDLHYCVDGKHYELPDLPPFNDLCRKHVTLRWNRRTATRVSVLWNGREFEAPVLERRFYPLVSEHPHLPRKNLGERWAEAAAGVDNSDLKLWGFHLDQHRSVPVLFRPEEEAVEIAAPAERVIPLTEAVAEVRRRIVGELGFLSPGQGEYLQAKFAAGATRALIEEAVAELTAEQEALA
jgi:hypothetical protein